MPYLDCVPLGPHTRSGTLPTGRHATNQQGAEITDVIEMQMPQEHLVQFVPVVFQHGKIANRTRADIEYELVTVTELDKE